jgi:hypothetical protein
MAFDLRGLADTSSNLIHTRNTPPTNPATPGSNLPSAMACDRDPSGIAIPMKSDAANRIRPFARETGVRAAVTTQPTAKMTSTRASKFINIPVDFSLTGHSDLGYAFVFPRFLRIESPRISMR